MSAAQLGPQPLMSPPSAPARAFERGIPEARAFWFGTTHHELFGLYHAPAADSGRLGIVLCNPFGYEAMCTQRPYQHLAEKLARQGHPVLRFDYHGTGNSSGNDRDPGRWAAWLDSVQRAIDELEQRSGCARVGLVGLRFGANLALLAAERRRDVVALAMWAPFYTGQAFLREELAVHKLRALQTVVSPQPRAATDPSTEIEALGFTLSAETLAALRAHSIAGLKVAPAREALVLTREPALQEERVAAQLSQLGVQVTCEAAPGYARMLAENEPPDWAWDRIVDYFETHADATLPSTLPKAPAPSAFRSSVSVWDAATAEAPVREVATRFGPGKRLFGIVTHGVPQLGIEPAPTVLLLAGGFNHHVGQNRMYTRWARAWAARGITSLRFDLSGLGESRARPGAFAGQLHDLNSVSDVRAAMDHLSATCGSRRFAIVGLCSGALMAFHTALADARVVRLGLLNWTRFIFEPGRQDNPSASRGYRSQRFYLKALVRGETWRKLLRGRIDLRGIGRTLFRRGLARLRTRLHVRAGVAGLASSPLARGMRSLAARGVHTLVVYNGDDPALDEFQELLGSEQRQLSALRLLKLEIMDGTDHIFTPVWSQERLQALLTADLLSH